MSSPPQKRKRFGEILVEAGVIKEVALRQALDRQKLTGRRLGEVLESMGIITEKDIAVVLSRQFGYRTVKDFSQAQIPADVLALCDGEKALKSMVFPLKKESNTLLLAMVNPLDIPVIDELAFRTGLRVLPCVTTSKEIHDAVNRHYYNVSTVQEKVDVARDTWWSVLVVDDQDMVRAATAAALKRLGYHLCEAANGAEAITLIAQVQPHLVITDTVMPRMDGYELFRAMQANSVARGIPVIALSSKSAPEEEAKLLDLGFFDFIAKPINPIRLVARVKRALRIVYGEHPPER